MSFESVIGPRKKHITLPYRSWPQEREQFLKKAVSEACNTAQFYEAYPKPGACIAEHIRLIDIVFDEVFRLSNMEYESEDEHLIPRSGMTPNFLPGDGTKPEPLTFGDVI
ncbi:hypothetical protein BROUX41_001462 [Berkeleyomyces rouxiae]|uniref:uncharacterized protein n=1 Tax=Berkeleyomyces rouxiae TaxID=2035830 RepID=UPI003B7678E1